MRLGFLGAAGEVTGSCYLVDTGEVKFLVDCGMSRAGARRSAGTGASPSIRGSEYDCALLRAFKALAVLNDAEIWELVHASHWARFPAQTTLMREGDKGSELLFLASGEVKVVKLGRLLNVLRTGSYFGEMAYVKAGAIPRQATVETMTDALIAEFRPGAMKKLSTHCQLHLSLSLLNTVVDRLAFADERIAHA